jgi:hypothetical protein
MNDIRPVLEKHYNKIIKQYSNLKGRAEEEVRYLLRKEVEDILKEIGIEIPIYSEKNRVDISLRDIAIETKRFDDSNLKDKYSKQLFGYMLENLFPYGVLTNLKEIYFFELSENGEITEIERDGNEFSFENFEILLSLIIKEERKRFISETSILMDFGYIEKNKLIKELLREFLEIFLKDNLSKKSKMFYSEWLKLFKLSESTNYEYIKQRRQALERIFNIEINKNNEYQAIFVIHTVISLIVKLLIYSFISRLNNQTIEYTPDITSLKKFFKNLESGKNYVNLGIINMCQYDFFSWYLDVDFNDKTYTLLASLKNRATQYRYIGINNVDRLKDTIQSLYENFMPKEIRRSFGEYYTPQKYADYILSKSKNFLKDKVSYKAIDPTCGSGTFLLSVIKDKIRLNRIEQVFDEVVGIDLNPIAVVMAKFNYILAVYPLLIKMGKVPTDLEIPVYLGDSSYMPTIKKIGGIECVSYKYYFPANMEIDFPEIVFPLDFVKSKSFITVLQKVETMILDDMKKEKIFAFVIEEIEKIINSSLNDLIKSKISDLIKTIIKYQKENLNSIWLFIFMNYLKPFAIGDFDLIIGNPPWVRWSVLPADYKSKIKNTLRNEGVFSRDTNYGGVDLNISALVAYRVTENLLNKGGVLSFIFPYGVLTNKSYEGFRNLQFGNKIMEIKQILKPSKPFFEGEEPIILILQNLESQS